MHQFMHAQHACCCCCAIDLILMRHDEVFHHVADACAPAKQSSLQFMTEQGWTGPDAVSFRAVMQKMNAAIAAAKITKSDTDVMLTQIGLKADELAPLVMPANAMLLAAFNQLLDAKLAA